MKTRTSERLYTGSEVASLLASAEQRILDTILPHGEFLARITRADGTVEEKVVKNIVLKEGLNRIANRAVQPTGTSVFYVIGVGSQTGTHSLSSDQPGFGEISRKTSAVTGANAQSREWIFNVATWGGAADSVTSLNLDTVFVADFPTSHATTGAYLAAASGLATVLANSDFLHITHRVRVGSHDIDHTT
jgi:hypothetical protein